MVTYLNEHHDPNIFRIQYPGLRVFCHGAKVYVGNNVEQVRLYRSLYKEHFQQSVSIGTLEQTDYVPLNRNRIDSCVKLFVHLVFLGASPHHLLALGGRMCPEHRGRTLCVNEPIDATKKRLGFGPRSELVSLF
jgi:hypothetical protein